MLAALFKQVGNPALTKQYEQISRQFPREADESAELAGEALAGMREKARELVRAGNPARAIPAIRQFLAASPYSRKAIFGSFSAITKWAIGWKWGNS